MLHRYIRIILCHFVHYRTPQSGRIQYIGFVYAADLATALSCDIKCFDRNTSDLLFRIGQGIDCLAYAVLLYGFALSEIKSAGQLTHNEQIKAFRGDLFL